ncbi:hypothetical protein EJ02DRAFT_456210 [Clathrospora elynae]|uniref:Yeast cell wall synthesis Kre9/Knh1-like N-terminal domain-containing protein n=1 Tax=Clathrospora elynae TaxID=706981 RepID=A0A6A5SKX1_9PLEO|nr:hypothetical protein EJ02DRAFT_456210 [Clathrospora elynae]
MRFFETILSGAAFVAAVAALEINSYPSAGVVAGQTYTVTYSPADNTPTTFILRQGKSTDLDTVDTITTTATGGSFKWTVPKTLANQPDYALEIKQGDMINYSAQFGLSGGSTPAVSSAVASIASSAASSASSAASSAASAASSASAAMSSAVSSAGASSTMSSSASLNSTVSSATLSKTASSTSKPTGTSSGSVPEATTNAASSVTSSRLAAIIGAVAAFAYLA